MSCANPLNFDQKIDKVEMFKDPKVDIDRFIALMHRFFYDQLRIEAKVC